MVMYWLTPRMIVVECWYMYWMPPRMIVVDCGNVLVDSYDESG